MTLDYEELLSHRGHDLTIVGEGEEDEEFTPEMLVLQCKSCDRGALLVVTSRAFPEFRECEAPGCEMKLPRADMVQLPGGEYFCPPHARDAERMP